MKRTNLLTGIAAAVIMLFGDIFPLWVTLGTKIIKSMVETITSVDQDDPFYQGPHGVYGPAMLILFIAILVIVLSVLACSMGRSLSVRRHVVMQTVICVLMVVAIVCEYRLTRWVQEMEADYTDLYIAWPIICATLLVAKIVLTISEVRQMQQEPQDSTRAM